MEKISILEFKKMTMEYAYEHAIPFGGSFELTPLCNLDCKMCYVHLQDSSVEERMLSSKQWILLMQGAIDEGMITALLTGGEAMPHPNFWDIYSYLINHGVCVRVKTNGILLTKDAIERFSEYPPDGIDISLYGCNSASYVAVTGSDVYSDALSNGLKKSWTEINSGIKNHEVPKQWHICNYNKMCHYCPVCHQKTADKHLCDLDECEFRKMSIDLMVASKAGEQQ